MTAPLAGITVVVTRARAQASDLVDALRAAGAQSIELPLIRIEDPADGGEALRAAVHDVASYDWVVFTSTNAVHRVGPLLSSTPRRVAAVGTATADALERAGIRVDLVPESFVAEALVAVFPGGPGRVLLPCAEQAREVLPEGLREKGWHVETVTAYRTAFEHPSVETLDLVRRADAITFTASSAVTNYVGLGGLDVIPPLVACIGPITAEMAERNGITVDVVASEHTIDGLVRALAEVVERHG